jgi:hypothetical protein
MFGAILKRARQGYDADRLGQMPGATSGFEMFRLVVG